MTMPEPAEEADGAPEGGPREILSAVNLWKSYGEVEALRGLTFTFKGGVMGLLGPNGAGKSTFIKIALGLLKADEGSVKILGRDVSDFNRDVKGQVGYMPEGECLPEALTGLQFVYHMGVLSGLPPKEAFQRAHAVMEFVGMGEQRYRKISSYSLGLKQRIKLAQAIVHDPILLFLDEPTSGLDPFGREEMLSLIEELKSAGKSIVLSTHILRDVERVAEEVVVLNRGVKLIQKNMKEVMKSGGWVEVTVVGETREYVEMLKKMGIECEVTGSKIRMEPPKEGGLFRLMEVAEEAGVVVRSVRGGIKDLTDLFSELMEEGGGTG
ncbi:MAG TPA: ABC transporter ATP-binding protein [Euryarchaeota archaeon]|nr:ABC transporter ATP-binding protein [Euryarchaeota archaeon]